MFELPANETIGIGFKRAQASKAAKIQKLAAVFYAQTGAPAGNDAAADCFAKM